MSEISDQTLMDLGRTSKEKSEKIAALSALLTESRNRVAYLEGCRKRLYDAIQNHWRQKADDRCIDDDDALYEAADLPPVDRCVGSKEEMLKNCSRFIDRRCEGGKWPSYVELEAKIACLEGLIKNGEPTS